MKSACRSIILMILFVAPLTQAQSDRQEQGNTKGIFVMSVAGKEQGTDRIESVAGERYVDEVRTAGGEERRMELTYEAGKPKLYRQTLNGAPELEVVIEKDMISFYEGLAMVGGMPLEEQTVIFEPSAYGEYGQMLLLLAKAKGAGNTFMVLIPSLQDYLQVQMERHGSDPLLIEGKKREATHYRLAIGKREVINIWAEGERVLALYLASKNLTVVDASIVALRDQVDRIIKRAM